MLKLFNRKKKYIFYINNLGPKPEFRDQLLILFLLEVLWNALLLCENTVKHITPEVADVRCTLKIEYGGRWGTFEYFCKHCSVHILDSILCLLYSEKKLYLFYPSLILDHLNSLLDLFGIKNTYILEKICIFCRILNLEWSISEMWRAWWQCIVLEWCMWLCVCVWGGGVRCLMCVGMC